MASPIRLALINVLRKLKLKSFVVQIVIKLKSDHTLLYNGFLAKFFPIFSAVTSYTTKNEDFRRWPSWTLLPLVLFDLTF